MKQSTKDKLQQSAASKYKKGTFTSMPGKVGFGSFSNGGTQIKNYIQTPQNALDELNYRKDINMKQAEALWGEIEPWVGLVADSASAIGGMKSGGMSMGSPKMQMTAAPKACHGGKFCHGGKKYPEGGTVTDLLEKYKSGTITNDEWKTLSDYVYQNQQLRDEKVGNTLQHMQEGNPVTPNPKWLWKDSNGPYGNTCIGNASECYTDKRYYSNQLFRKDFKDLGFRELGEDEKRLPGDLGQLIDSKKYNNAHSWILGEDKTGEGNLDEYYASGSGDTRIKRTNDYWGKKEPDATHYYRYDPGYDVTSQMNSLVQQDLSNVANKPKYSSMTGFSPMGETKNPLDPFANGGKVLPLIPRNNPYDARRSYVPVERDKRKKVFPAGGMVADMTAPPNEYFQAFGINTESPDFQSLGENAKMDLLEMLKQRGKITPQGQAFLDRQEERKFNASENFMSTQSEYAFGGKANQQIEIEGGEIVEFPNGQVQGYEGPSHEQGGIPLNAPQGTKIYSDQLIAEDGRTFAERKELRTKREEQLNKKESRLNKYLAKSKKDSVAAETHKRKMMSLEQERIALQEQDNNDMAIMDAFSKTVGSGSYSDEEFGSGGIHIAPSKRGTFKVQASKMGLSVQQAASKILNAEEGTYSPAMRKKANFAKNFAHGMGGTISEFADGGVVFKSTDYKKYYKYDPSTNIWYSVDYKTAGEETPSWDSELWQPRKDKDYLSKTFLNEGKLKEGYTNEYREPYIPFEIPSERPIFPLDYKKKINGEWITPDPIINSDDYFSPADIAKNKMGIGDENMGSGNIPETMGNVLGYAGTAISALGPLWATLKNKKESLPIKNNWIGYGQKAIDEAENAKKYVAQIRDSALQRALQQQTNQMHSNRNNAMGVNTQRALDLSTYMAGNEAANQIYNQDAAQMMQLSLNEAQLKNEADLKRRMGADAYDDKRQQTIDAYYSNLGSNLANIGGGLQQSGVNRNVTEYNQQFLDMLPDVSMYGLGYEYNPKTKKFEIKKLTT